MLQYTDLKNYQPTKSKRGETTSEQGYLVVWNTRDHSAWTIGNGEPMHEVKSYLLWEYHRIAPYWRVVLSCTILSYWSLSRDVRETSERRQRDVRETVEGRQSMRMINIHFHSLYCIRSILIFSLFLVFRCHFYFCQLYLCFLYILDN